LPKPSNFFLIIIIEINKWFSSKLISI
jgi:hypothetical protein